MLQQPVRRVALLLAALAGSAGCAPGEAAPLLDYLRRGPGRRAALLSALWFQDNDYARLRLARFAVEGARSWELLPEWLPPTAPVRTGPEQAPPLPAGPPELPVEAGEEALRAALLRLGEAAFFDYPAQLVGGLERAVAAPELAEAYGLWRGRAPADPADAAPRLGGLLRVELPAGGGTALALSCSSCHASGDGAQALPGAPSRALDLGAVAQDQAPLGVELPEGRWGPGRLDVSPDGADNPVSIPDLRVVGRQRYLHHDATVRSDDPGAAPLALAVRTETLLITTLAQAGRPPPAVALGLALYLRSLAPPAGSDTDAPGPEVFVARCQRCHAPPDYAGGPVPLDEIGTDPAAGRSRERGTGGYRIPTLRGVARRGPLLHDGRVPDLAALLDPARLQAGYRGALHGAGPVPGHAYGLDLSSAERAALLSFLSTL